MSLIKVFFHPFYVYCLSCCFLLFSVSYFPYILSPFSSPTPLIPYSFPPIWSHPDSFCPLPFLSVTFTKSTFLWLGCDGLLKYYHMVLWCPCTAGSYKCGKHVLNVLMQKKVFMHSECSIWNSFTFNSLVHYCDVFV